jgi:alkyl-hydroperoxide reductase/thiol specific antioxidant family protein
VRDAYEEIRASGADVLAIGTGNVNHAREFVEEEDIPFPVLVDDDADAARAASVKRGTAWKILGPETYGASLRTWRAGHRIHAPGKRVFQLGATFVVGPGNVVHYEHLDENTADHAPLEVVLKSIAVSG